jgi:hypothetical protein
MGVVAGADVPRADVAGSGHDEEAVPISGDGHTAGPDQTGQEPADDTGDAGFDDQ